MTQQEFLRALARELRGVPEPERSDTLRYYKRYIHDAGLKPDADVTKLVGSPEMAARGVLADLRIREERTEAAERKSEKTRHTALAIIAVPIALVVFVILLGFGALGAGLAIGGVVMPILTIGTPQSVGQLLVMIGYGVLMFAVGTLLNIGVAVLWSLTARALKAVLGGKGAYDA